ncbi:hypothetical protein MPNTM1_00228 [Mycolicibacterium parafortuitum]
MRKQTLALFVAGALPFAAIATAPMAQAKELGGVNVQSYCANVNNRGGLQGNVGTERNPSDAYSWRCVYTPPGPFAGGPTKRSVNMNVACSQQHGNGAWGKPLNPRDASSWRCYR